MAKNDKKTDPHERPPLAELKKLGTLDEVLNSGASLEIKAAAIEMEIEARERRKAKQAKEAGQPGAEGNPGH